MKTKLQSIAFKAQTHPKHRFQNLYGLLDSELLVQSWGQINKRSKGGVDGVTIKDFKQRLPENIERLHRQLKDKSYRVGEVMRSYIEKDNGKKRPLGLPIIDDKVVQQSTVQILSSIWEQDFVCNSYGYRPLKSAHAAIQSLQMNLQFRTYNYIVEADIKGFFDNMSHKWLMKMLAERIDDKAFLNLINQWLKAKIVHPEGNKTKPKSGTPQGGVISPILANIYLHYALDIWFEERVKPQLKGKAMLIRYADDFVVAFSQEEDAVRFYQELPKRLKEFDLDVAPEKTHLKEFGSHALSKEHSFQFLGFEFYWDKDRKGKAVVRRRTASKKHNAALEKYGSWIKENRSMKLGELLPELRAKLRGFAGYFDLPDNSLSVKAVYRFVEECLYKWLNCRSQRRSFNWQGLRDVLRYFQVIPRRIVRSRIKVDWY